MNADPHSLSVTAVIPCYNAAADLPRTLDALLSQTHVPDEIIVVDDGSSDHSVAVAQSFGPRVRVIRQANAGAGSARFRGVEAAECDIIVFNDAGDVSRPRRVELMVRAFVDRPECVAAYGITWIKSRSEPTTSRLTGGPLDEAMTVVGDPLNRMLGLSWPLAIGMNLAVRRSVARQSSNVGPFYRAANDYALQIQTACRGSFVHVAAVTLDYEETIDGLSSRNGYIQQTAFSLCAAVESYERERGRRKLDLEGFRQRLDREWPGIALHMYLRKRYALMRRIVWVGVRYGRWMRAPLRLWWALDKAAHDGALKAAPVLRAFVRAANRFRSSAGQP